MTLRKDKVMRDLQARDKERKQDALLHLHQYELPPHAIETNMTSRSATSYTRWTT